jgi:hypothetical protein
VKLHVTLELDVFDDTFVTDAKLLKEHVSRVAKSFDFVREVETVFATLGLDESGHVRDADTDAKDKIRALSSRLRGLKKA